jgi:hypothetical integral membrane protein (TIGR02206 family)
MAPFEDALSGAGTILLNPFGMGVFLATVSTGPYWTGVALLALGCVILCTWARLRPGRWCMSAAKVIGLVLLADCVVDTVRQLVDGTWSDRTSLPLALCNFALLIAAAACWWRPRQLVELTYFWGLAGTLQGLLTPDLNVPFPQVEFFEYVIGHTLIIVAALYLVVGMRLQPRRGSVLRVSVITYIYVAVVGVADVILKANYMFLRRGPHQWTLLRLMGPYPWYLGTGVLIVPIFFGIAYSPFWLSRRHHAEHSSLSVSQQAHS